MKLDIILANHRLCLKAFAMFAIARKKRGMGEIQLKRLSYKETPPEILGAKNKKINTKDKNTIKYGIWDGYKNEKGA